MRIGNQVVGIPMCVCSTSGYAQLLTNDPYTVTANLNTVSGYLDHFKTRSKLNPCMGMGERVSGRTVRCERASVSKSSVAIEWMLECEADKQMHFRLSNE